MIAVFAHIVIAALAVWLLLEITAQAGRYGLIVVIVVPFDIPNRSGLCFHPLFVVVDKHTSIPHERRHAYQQANGWLLWWYRYGFDGRWRFSYEAEAEVYEITDKMPILRRHSGVQKWWVTRTATRLTDPDGIYFGTGWPWGNDAPDLEEAKDVLLAYMFQRNQEINAEEG